MRRLLQKSSPEAGFTLIELMVVVTLTAIGLVSLLNLQGNTINAVGAARSMTEATNLAEHCIGSLKAEASEWVMGGTSMIAQTTRFPSLSTAGTPTLGGGSGWQVGMVDAGTDKRIGLLGNDTVMDVGILNEFPPTRNRKFCVHYRLTWLIPDFLLRADVRILWIRSSGGNNFYPDCRVGMESDLANVRSVTIPAAIGRNVFIR